MYDKILVYLLLESIHTCMYQYIFTSTYTHQTPDEVYDNFQFLCIPTIDMVIVSSCPQYKTAIHESRFLWKVVLVNISRWVFPTLTSERCDVPWIISWSSQVFYRHLSFCQEYGSTIFCAKATVPCILALDMSAYLFF